MKSLEKKQITYSKEVQFADFRAGDVMHSQADISKAQNYLHYRPTHNILAGIEKTAAWYAPFTKD